MGFRCSCSRKQLTETARSRRPVPTEQPPDYTHATTTVRAGEATKPEGLAPKPRFFYGKETGTKEFEIFGPFSYGPYTYDVPKARVTVTVNVEEVFENSLKVVEHTAANREKAKNKNKNKNKNANRKRRRKEAWEQANTTSAALLEILKAPELGSTPSVVEELEEDGGSSRTLSRAPEASSRVTEAQLEREEVCSDCADGSVAGEVVESEWQEDSKADDDPAHANEKIAEQGKRTKSGADEGRVEANRSFQEPDWDKESYRSDDSSHKMAIWDSRAGVRALIATGINCIRTAKQLSKDLDPHAESAAVNEALDKNLPDDGPATKEHKYEILTGLYSLPICSAY